MGKLNSGQSAGKERKMKEKIWNGVFYWRFYFGDIIHVYRNTEIYQMDDFQKKSIEKIIKKTEENLEKNFEY